MGIRNGSFPDNGGQKSYVLLCGFSDWRSPSVAHYSQNVYNDSEPKYDLMLQQDQDLKKIYKQVGAHRSKNTKCLELC